jgi:uncharacterized protein YndB with AHSA1/START domain
MFTADADVTIKRPLEEVFAFVGTAAEFPRWQKAVVESRQTSDGPPGVGATGVNVRKVMGQSIETNWVVTAYQVNESYTVKSTAGGPVAYELPYTFTTVEGGTRVQARLQAEAKGPLKVMEGMIAGSVKEEFAEDHQHLKTLLESGS